MKKWKNEKIPLFSEKERKTQKFDEKYNLDSFYCTQRVELNGISNDGLNFRIFMKSQTNHQKSLQQRCVAHLWSRRSMVTHRIVYFIYFFPLNLLLKFTESFYLIILSSILFLQGFYSTIFIRKSIILF